jgi:hypothetical protein
MQMKRVLADLRKHLHPDDLGPERAVVVQLLRIEMTAVGGDRLPVAFFAGKKKGLVLRPPNIKSLIEIFGTDDSETWLGRRVELFTTMIDTPKGRELAIRVRASRTSSGDPQPRREAAAPREPGDDDDHGALHASDMRW